MNKLKAFGLFIFLLIVLALGIYINNFESYYDNGTYYCSKLQDNGAKYLLQYGGSPPKYLNQLYNSEGELFRIKNTRVDLPENLNSVSFIDTVNQNSGNHDIEIDVNVDIFDDFTGLVITSPQPLFTNKKFEDYNKDQEYKIIIDISWMMIRTVFDNKYSYMNGILFTEINLDKDSGYIVVGFIDIRHVIEHLKNNPDFIFDSHYN